MITKIKNLGPGLLFAGAAIGVSHLVQSTRAGADFGLGLLWALLLANLFKYPFFQYGPKYAAATGESLLYGYKKLGKGVLAAYYILTLATMFTIQTAVTIVTAGLASSLFGNLGFDADLTIKIWTVIILLICLILLLVGKYKLLDNLIKIIIVVLSLSTIAAVSMAFYGNHSGVSFTQIFPKETPEIIFLIAFMGWMPAPLDVSVWHSLWAVEKHKDTKSKNPNSALFDFNVGYLGTVFLGVCFVLLGCLVMFGTDKSFGGSAGQFANQLIDMYTGSIGKWAKPLVAIAAFTTMFSTTLTCLDASPRAMNKTQELLLNRNYKHGYLIWILLLVLGTISIFFFFASEMGLLVKIATILSFITAPFYAFINFRLISSKHTPKAWHPNKYMKILSWSGIVFLIGFSIWYLTTL